MNISELIARLHALDVPDAHVRVGIAVTGDHGVSDYEADIKEVETEYNCFDNGADVGFVIIVGELSV